MFVSVIQNLYLNIFYIFNYQHIICKRKLESICLLLSIKLFYVYELIKLLYLLLI